MTLADLRTVIYADTTFKKNIVYDANQNAEYIGIAPPGTSDTVASWQIRKITYDVNENPTDIDFAGSSTSFDKIWDNYASYTYG